MVLADTEVFWAMLTESCTHHLEGLLCKDGHAQHSSCTLQFTYLEQV